MLLHFFALNCSHASVLTSQQNHFWLAIELHINESQYLCRYVFLWMSIFATNQRQPILKRCWLLIAVAVRINWSVYLLQMSMKVNFCNQSSGSMMNWTEKRRKLIIMSSNKWLAIHHLFLWEFPLSFDFRYIGCIITGYTRLFYLCCWLFSIILIK